MRLLQQMSDEEVLELTTLQDTFDDTLNTLYGDDSDLDGVPAIGDFWDKLVSTSVDNYHEVLEDFKHYQIPGVLKDANITYNSSLEENQIKHDLEGFRCFYKRLLVHLEQNYQKLKNKERSLIRKVKKKEGLLHHLDNLEKFQEVISTPTETEQFQNMIKHITDSIQHDEISEEMEVYVGHHKLHRDLMTQLQNLRILQNKPLCPICFAQSIDVALIPCGHSMCHCCYQKIVDKHNEDLQEPNSIELPESPLCALCRKEIEFHQKIYFS